MTLPHYKLHAPQQTFGMESFPVVMVPNDEPAQSSHLKDVFFSRPTQVITAVISMTAVATALWVYFEPTTALIPARTGSLILMASSAITGITVILLVFSAIHKFQSRDSFTTPPETISLSASRAAVSTLTLTPPSSIEGAVLAFEQYKQLATEQANAVEFLCEEFVSEPFIEFLDEAVIAEVFSDEMIAPDCLIFSLEVKENVTQ